MMTRQTSIDFNLLRKWLLNEYHMSQLIVQCSLIKINDRFNQKKKPPKIGKIIF